MSNICNMSLCRAWFRARAKTSKEVMEIFFYSSVLLKFWPHKVEKLGLINDSILDYFSVNYLIDSWGSYLSIAEMDGRNSRVQPEAYKEINWGETNLDAVWKQTATASQTSWETLLNGKRTKVRHKCLERTRLKHFMRWKSLLHVPKQFWYI